MKRKKGMIYLLTLIISIVMVIIFVSYMLSSNVTLLNAVKYKNYVKVNYVATAGIEEAISRINSNIYYSNNFSGEINGIIYVVTITDIEQIRDINDNLIQKKSRITCTATYNNITKRIEAEVEFDINNPADILSWKIIK